MKYQYGIIYKNKMLADFYYCVLQKVFVKSKNSYCYENNTEEDSFTNGSAICYCTYLKNFKSVKTINTVINFIEKDFILCSENELNNINANKYFISEYNKHYMCYNYDSTYDNIIKKIKNIFFNSYNITFNICNHLQTLCLTDFNYSNIVTMPQLKYLIIHNSNTLNFIEYQPQLKYLELLKCHNIESVENQTNLTQLCIINCKNKIKIAGLKKLSMLILNYKTYQYNILPQCIKHLNIVNDLNCFRNLQLQYLSTVKICDLVINFYSVSLAFLKNIYSIKVVLTQHRTIEEIILITKPFIIKCLEINRVNINIIVSYSEYFLNRGSKMVIQNIYRDNIFSNNVILKGYTISGTKKLNFISIINMINGEITYYSV